MSLLLLDGKKRVNGGKGKKKRGQMQEKYFGE
jgi:hypothetical protein